ncbi:MAG: type II secretion system protein [Candidatus Zambryskibacteria bacterium]|nr:type II secretion system protein [Candidatus Zambryskibacteria bacterium]
MIKKFSRNSGYILIQVLVFGAMALIIIAGLVSFAGSNIRLGRRTALSEQAFQMAEAGLEYYRWHLAHSPTDYKDGTGLPGPYVKNFYDRNGVSIGTFTLTITAPPLGSSLVTIQSVGSPSIDTNVRRTIVSRLAIPSFANFAAVTDAANRFGEGTEVFGPIHSNNGIRFDGLAHNLVTSAVANYNDTDHSGNNEFGVHTHINPLPGTGVDETFRADEAPPSAAPFRSDIFVAGRSFPVSVVSFDDITADLTQMKTDAQAGGRYFGDSGDEGYKVILKTDDTFDVYRVDSLQNVPGGCSSSGQTDWGSWSTSATTFLGNYSFPDNGLIFFADHIWVEGTMNTARVTITAANIPDSDSNNRKSITINNDIRYTNYDGADVVALIGQDNVNVGMNSETDLRIDAALVAQNGRVGRYLYESDCSPYDNRDVLTLYGTMITSERYGFAYTDGSGYDMRNLIYDSFLLYSPPPFFPKTEDFHEVISWKEI